MTDSAIQVETCMGCGAVLPRHRHFCPKAPTERRAVARELLHVETRRNRLHVIAAELRGLEEPLAAHHVERAAAALRHEFWEWARKLGVPTMATAADIRRLAVDLDLARRAET